MSTEKHSVGGWTNPQDPNRGFPELGVPSIMENQMEKKMENEMETEFF